MARHTLLSLSHLTKRYGNAPVAALSDVSLHVNSGEVYGFLGANGAGKSTTIRLLLNFIEPSSGSAHIMGKDVVTDSVAITQHVGYLAGDVALYNKLTGKELLHYLSDLSGNVDHAYRQRLCTMFEAELAKPISDLSKGNRQKLGIIQAFMHQPDVLILDEPTSGLDPLMQEAFFTLIAETKQRGAAIFMSSHNFSEVQRTCDRIGIIRKGVLVAERSITELGDTKQHFTITFAGAPPLAALQKVPGLTIVGTDGNVVRISLGGQMAPLFGLLAKHHVVQLSTQTADLEEEFLQFYKEEDAA